MSSTGHPVPVESPPFGEPLPFEALSQYLLRPRGEILFILRALLKTKSLITLHFGGNTGLLTSALLAVDEFGLVLDAGPDDEVNRRVAVAGDVICAAILDRIRIQFALSGQHLVQYAGRPAFAAPLPVELLRLQRREYYRLVTPIAHPIKCRIGGGHGEIEVNLIDLSGGGLALVTPPEHSPFEPGMEFGDCRIDLPDVGTIVAAMRVRTVFELTLSNGTVSRRAGCQFINLPGPMLTRIQRYIIRVERERKALETGLA